MSQNQIRDILLSATNSSEALLQIYQLRKLKQSTLSLAKLCQLTGIKSKGYLSEVFAGKKLIGLDYFSRLASALNLVGIENECLRLLVEMDQTVDEKSKRTLKKKLAGLRKSLVLLESTDSQEKPFKLFEFEVYCAFGLFQGRPSRHDLLGFFGRERFQEIDRTLQSLKERSWIEPAETEGAEGPLRWQLVRDQVLFANDKQNTNHREFLRQAISDAADNLEAWYGKREQAHFESFIISVKSEDYNRELQAFRERLLVLCSQLETTEGDQLVKINLQAYPLRRNQ